MTSEKISATPCNTCSGNNKGKLGRIVEGWRYSIFKDPEVEKVATQRALRCATCDFNKDMLDSDLEELSNPLGISIPVCTKCYCPISAKTRSPEETCPIRRW